VPPAHKQDVGPQAIGAGPRVGGVGNGHHPRFIARGSSARKLCALSGHAILYYLS